MYFYCISVRVQLFNLPHNILMFFVAEIYPLLSLFSIKREKMWLFYFPFEHTFITAVNSTSSIHINTIFLLCNDELIFMMRTKFRDFIFNFLSKALVINRLGCPFH